MDEYVIVGTSHRIDQLKDEIARMHELRERMERRITEQNNKIGYLTISVSNQKRRIAEYRIQMQEQDEQLSMLQEDRRTKIDTRILPTAPESGSTVLYGNPHRWSSAVNT